MKKLLLAGLAWFVGVSTVAAEPPPPRLEPPIMVGKAEVRPHWVRWPTRDDFRRAYPERAISRERPGTVALDCRVLADGRIACSVGSEEPQGWGYGRANLSLAQAFRLPTHVKKEPTEGRRLEMTINFRMD